MREVINYEKDVLCIRYHFAAWWHYKIDDSVVIWW